MSPTSTSTSTFATFPSASAFVMQARMPWSPVMPPVMILSSPLLSSPLLLATYKKTHPHSTRICCQDS